MRGSFQQVRARGAARRSFVVTSRLCIVGVSLLVLGLLDVLARQGRVRCVFDALETGGELLVLRCKRPRYPERVHGRDEVLRRFGFVRLLDVSAQTLFGGFYDASLVPALEVV